MSVRELLMSEMLPVLAIGAEGDWMQLLLFPLLGLLVLLLGIAPGVFMRGAGEPDDRRAPEPELPPPGEAGGPGSRAGGSGPLDVPAARDPAAADGDGGHSLVSNGQGIGIGMAAIFWVLVLLLVAALVWYFY